MKRYIAALICFLFIVSVLCSCNNKSQVSSDFSKGDKMYVLDNININDLFSKNLGEVIEILGNNHSKPVYFEGAAIIRYTNSCAIAYDATDTDEPQLDPYANIVGINIMQKADVYKGISVGKSFEEINENPNLINSLSIEFNEKDNVMSSYAYYKYNDITITIFLDFDQNMICTNIFLRLEKSNVDYIEI